MPLLNCVVKSDQSTLLQVLKALHDDLKKGDMDTLKNFHVEWKHVNMAAHQPTSLESMILNQMCQEAAKGVEVQCAREYWGDPNLQQRAAELFKMSPDQIKNLPTHNLDAERDLARMGYLASLSAAHSNKKFKGKRIRDDLVLTETTTQAQDVDMKYKKIFKTLKEMEQKWTESQKKEMESYIRKRLQADNKVNHYTKEILRKCKEHDGPITSCAELQQLQKRCEGKAFQRALRSEIIFQRLMNPQDHQARPKLYKVNGMSVGDMLINFTELLCEGATNENSVVQFPTSEEMEVTLTSMADQQQPDQFTFQQPLAVVWHDEESETSKWYIGFYLDGNIEQSIRVDHLVGEQDVWKRPLEDDIQEVVAEQIIPVVVDGEWKAVTGDGRSDRYMEMKYMVKNWKEIEAKKDEKESQQ